MTDMLINKAKAYNGSVQFRHEEVAPPGFSSG